MSNDRKKTFKVPRKEINNRIAALQKELQRNGIDGVLIIQRADLFYFSGTAQNGCLYVPVDHKPLLFIKQNYQRALAESSIATIFEIRSIKDIPHLIQDHIGRSPSIIGFELDVMPVNEFNFYHSLFNPNETIDASPSILKVRKIKSAWEIEQLEATATMTAATFEYMRSAICPGLTEMEFAGIFETHARKLGHGGKLRVRNYQTEGYPWHVLSGESGGMIGLLDSPASGEGTSAAFPVGAGHRKLKVAEPIMIDLASVMNGYHADETRMFAIDSMPAKAQEASLAAIAIHDQVINLARPGIVAGELFDRAVATARSLGYETQFLGPPGYKTSFIGHGIGVELIEPPIIARGKTDVLEPGMTLALEPKMVFENEFSAGIESIIVITETGSRLISKIPIDFFIC